MSKEPRLQNPIVCYQTEDGDTRTGCRFYLDTLWLTQARIAELFRNTCQNVTLHLKSIFAEVELTAEATCKEYLQVRKKGRPEAYLYPFNTTESKGFPRLAISSERHKRSVSNRQKRKTLEAGAKEGNKVLRENSKQLAV